MNNVRINGDQNNRLGYNAIGYNRRSVATDVLNRKRAGEPLESSEVKRQRLDAVQDWIQPSMSKQDDLSLKQAAEKLWQTTYTHAKQLCEAKQFQLALKIISDFVEQNPDYKKAQYYQLVSACYYGLNLYSSMREVAETGLALCESNSDLAGRVEFLFDLAYANYLLKDFTEAYKYCDKFLVVCRDDHYRRFSIYAILTFIAFAKKNAGKIDEYTCYTQIDGYAYYMLKLIPHILELSSIMESYCDWHDLLRILLGASYRKRTFLHSKEIIMILLNQCNFSEKQKIDLKLQFLSYYFNSSQPDVIQVICEFFKINKYTDPKQSGLLTALPLLSFNCDPLLLKSVISDIHDYQTVRRRTNK